MMAQRTAIGPALIAIIGVVIAVLGTLSLAVIPETQSGLIVRGGEVTRIYNAPTARNATVGGSGAGLIWRVPLIDRLVRYDRRVQSVGGGRVALTGPEATAVTAEVSARYRVVDPARLYRTAATEGAARLRLEALLGDALRRAFGGGATALTPATMELVRTAFAERARALGVEAIDVSVDRLVVAPGAGRDAVFARMRDQQGDLARTVIAEGNARANAVRAEGDAQIAQLQRDSFGRDPEFYEFYRAMQSYETTFRSEGAGRATWALPPNEGYLRHLDPTAR